MLAPDQSVGPEPDRQQCSVDFADSGSRCRPGTDIGTSCPIAVIGRTESSIPVIYTVLLEIIKVSPNTDIKGAANY